MDAIPEDKMLRHHPDTMHTIRKMYNLDGPGDIDNAITTLQDWLKKQHNFTKKDYPRTYLERLLILQKGSLQRTKKQIESICAMRTLLPKYFDGDLDETVLKLKAFHTGFLPTLTEDNYRIFAVKFSGKEFNSKLFFVLYKFSVCLAEYVLRHDYCSGLIFIIDYSDVNILDIIAVTNITELYQIIKILTVGYALRIKQIHVITPSKQANGFINFVKKMLSTKIANRLYVHPNKEALYEFLPRDILPAEFGGNENSLASIHNQWKDVLRSEKMMNYLKEMSEAKSSETYKMKDAINDPDLGISGSFRSLNVD